MKFNLENRPKSPMPCEEFAVQSAKWFEGFEKELRELDSILTKPRPNVVPLVQIWRNARHELIKEILGEWKRSL